MFDPSTQYIQKLNNLSKYRAYVTESPNQVGVDHAPAESSRPLLRQLRKDLSLGDWRVNKILFNIF